jgi:RNA polymerase sigma-70 factor (ECF subfamily)
MLSQVGTERESNAGAVPDSSELLNRLRSGEEEAFEIVVRKYSTRLLAAARRIVNNEEQARDVLQDALLAAFRSLSAFKGEAQIYTWLYRIVVNCALMRLRSRRRKPEQPIESLLPTFADDGHHSERVWEWRTTPESELERSETRRLVLDCVNKLPENYRVVLLLRDIEELDTAETARALGTSVNSVKIRLHRARQALRTLLAPHLSACRQAV